MAPVECLAVRLSSLTLQHQQRTFFCSDCEVAAFSRSNCGVARQQRTPLPKSSPLSRKRHNAALAFEKCKEIRLQERGTKGVLRRKDLHIRAISSTGPLVSDWGEGGEKGLKTLDETKEEVVQEVTKKKKRVIAGVDQTKLLEPHLLADPDSRFAEYYGVQIHHKIARPSVNSSSCSPSSTSVAGVDGQRVNLPAILLHGFGASLFSWEVMMPKLAEILEAPALAFDRPGFGFTSRTFPPSSSCPVTESPQQNFKNSYTVAFSAAATLAFVEFLKFDQAILIGHSAGSLVAVDAYFQSPEKIAALILVAPSVLAPLLMQQMAASKTASTGESERASEKKSEAEEIKSEKTFSLRFGAALLWMWMKTAAFLRMARKFVHLVYRMLVGFLFRSPPATWLVGTPLDSVKEPTVGTKFMTGYVVYTIGDRFSTHLGLGDHAYLTLIDDEQVRRIMDKGGPWAVRYAFYDVVKADKYVLDGYTKPLQCRDWERALLEYCLAGMDNTEEQAAGKKKLQDVKCPVLVVTGDTDRIVPDWNSENLAKVFPSAEFKRIKNCGHLPHEETPDEFVGIIKDWLSRTLMKETKSLEPATSSV